MKLKHQMHQFKKPSVSIALAIIMAGLAGCNLPGRFAANTTPTALPSSIPLPTSTLPATTTPTPTNTATPELTPTNAPVNIVFATGTTAAAEEGNLQPNQVQSYTLSAEKNQAMILLLSSSNNDMYLGVDEPNGNVLLDSAKKWTNFQWLLPQTELYTIRVYSGAHAGTFTLTTKVAERINFAAGSSSIELSGTTLKGYVFSYDLYAKANQGMTVSLNVPASTAYLDIFGLASGTLLSAAEKSVSWSGTLPSDQDYIIEVIPANGQVINYTLKVTVQ